MTKQKAYSSLLALAFTLLSVACGQEQEPTSNNYSQEIYQPTGATVELNLAGSVVEDAPRALDFEIKTEGTNEGLPTLQLPQAGSQVPVLCILRKLGAPNSTTYAQLKWTVTEDGKGLRYVGPVQLAEGEFTKAEADKWYIMAILGGTANNVGTGADVSQANVSVASTTLVSPAGGKLTMDIPYIMPWTKLSILTDEWAEHKSLRFYPQGVFVRHQIRNGMVDSYQVSALKLSSNVMSNAGSFDISKNSITDAQLQGTTTRQKADGTSQEYNGVLPSWRPQTSGQSYTVGMDPYAADSRMWRQSMWPVYDPEAFSAQGGTTYYSSYGLPSAIEIASGATSQAYYGWAMPIATTEEPRSDYYLTAQSTVVGDSQLYEALPAGTTKTRPLSGVFYRVYPEISSDLIVSEVINISYGQPDVSVDANDDPLFTGGTDASGDMEGDNLDDDGWETGATPSKPSDGGGDGLGAPVVRNLSMVELYNPTLDTIDLSNYAIVRTFLAENTPYVNFSSQAFHLHGTGAATSPMEATALPLSLLDGNGNPGPFATWPANTGVHTPHSKGKARYRVLAGNSMDMKIYPGKTVLLAASSYLDAEPTDPEFETDLARRDVLAVVREAVAKGYCQYAVAYSNGSEEGEGFAYAPESSTSGTLDFGATDGIVLVRSKGTGYQIVDLTTPSMSSAYLDNDSKHQSDFALFKARYIEDPNASSPRLHVTTPYKGYSRHRGSNHPAVPPFYGAIGQSNSYTKIWLSAERKSYADPKPLTDSYTYGHRYERVSSSTANFSSPAPRPWPRTKK